MRKIILMGFLSTAFLPCHSFLNVHAADLQEQEPKAPETFSESFEDLEKTLRSLPNINKKFEDSAFLKRAKAQDTGEISYTKGKELLVKEYVTNPWEIFKGQLEGLFEKVALKALELASKESSSDKEGAKKVFNRKWEKFLKPQKNNTDGDTDQSQFNTCYNSLRDMAIDKIHDAQNECEDLLGEIISLKLQVMTKEDFLRNIINTARKMGRDRLQEEKKKPLDMTAEKAEKEKIEKELAEYSEELKELIITFEKELKIQESLEELRNLQEIRKGDLNQDSKTQKIIQIQEKIKKLKLENAQKAEVEKAKKLQKQIEALKKTKGNEEEIKELEEKKTLLEYKFEKKQQDYLEYLNEIEEVRAEQKKRVKGIEDAIKNLNKTIFLNKSKLEEKKIILNQISNDSDPMRPQERFERQKKDVTDTQKEIEDLQTKIKKLEQDYSPKVHERIQALKESYLKWCNETLQKMGFQLTPLILEPELKSKSEFIPIDLDNPSEDPSEAQKFLDELEQYNPDKKSQSTQVSEPENKNTQTGDSLGDDSEGNLEHSPGKQAHKKRRQNDNNWQPNQSQQQGQGGIQRNQGTSTDASDNTSPSPLAPQTPSIKSNRYEDLIIGLQAFIQDCQTKWLMISSNLKMCGKKLPSALDAIGQGIGKIDRSRQEGTQPILGQFKQDKKIEKEPPNI